MTKSEIIAQLVELGVEHDPSSSKAVLSEQYATAVLGPAPIEQAIQPAARESNSGSNTPRPVWEAGESRSEYHARVHAWKLEQRS